MRNLFFREKKNKNSGFTLVEMIVVLVILGILASAAVYSIIAYINLSRFRNNNEDALSIYQSAQAAVNHMEKAGTSEQLALDIIGKGTASPFNNSNADGIDNIYNSTYFDSFPVADTAPGESAHMRYAVTCTPGGNDDQSKIIKDLIYADFSSTDIFNGIITIEFDVEKMLDNFGTVKYSVNVYSVFYDSGRKNWSDSTATNNGISGVVPYREEDYRFDKSFIGYCNGNSTPTAVDSVLLPDESEIKSTIVTLRNGETLDISWSATAEGEPITGKPQNIHYVISLFDSDIKGNVVNNKICDLVVNEYSVLEGLTATSPSTINWYNELEFEKSNFVENNIQYKTIGSVNYPIVYTSETVRDRRGVTVNIYKATIKTAAKVYLRRNTNQGALDNFVSGYNNLTYNDLTQSNNYYTFPLTISYEIHEGDGVADRISYTLSLDAMMSRNMYNSAESTNAAIRTLNYSFYRLYSGSTLQKNIVPMNIYAEMVMAPNAFTKVDTSYNYTGSFTQSDVFMAERALDDPVYLQPNGSYSYVANLVDHDRGKNYAVVNTYFGDLGSGTFGTNMKNNANEVEAVITSYRHLSNMRLLREYGYPVRYSICRDLNWYSFGTGGTYSSEVVVYSGVAGGSGLTGHSPVRWPESSDYSAGYTSYKQRLDVVSFPSIPYNNKMSVLIAVDNTLAPTDAADKTSVINNVQMRMPSFYDTNLKAYGLICTNNGTIINIRANGLTLLLDNLDDGSPDDRGDIKTAVEQLRNPNHTVTSTESPAWQTSSPVGGLVGANNGTIGSQTETDINKNTIRFSNCIVMSGHWSGSEWVVFRVSAVGIMIGDNNGANGSTAKSIYGLMETTGTFASSGYIDVGGTIGYSIANIDAQIRVDNTKDRDKAIITFDNNATSVIFGTADAIGGAIGSINGGGLSQNVSCGSNAPFTLTTDSLGRIQTTLGLNPVYAIDIKLDANSYIICKTDDPPKKVDNNRPSGFGGAIGRIGNYNRDILSIRVENAGRILSSEGTTYGKSLGGAIGVIIHGTISEAYIKVVNGGQIGSENVTYADSTGGAVGRINDLQGLLGRVNIDVINNGQISGNCTRSNSRTGVGGAVGTIMEAYGKMPVYYINSFDNGTISGKTLTPGGNEGTNNFGVGGAVGHLHYIPANSAFYCIVTSGNTITANGNNAGGCIGSEASGVSGTGTTTITANLQNGTSVIATGANAGGVFGNAGCISRNVIVRAIVTGNVTINAASDAGGISGRFKIGSDNSTSKVYLLTETSGSVLTIKASAGKAADPALGNDNAGGLFGIVSDGGKDVEFGVELNLPTQTGNNVMIVKVESYDNAGGMIGDMKHQGNTVPEMTVVFHPSSYVRAHNDNAGGCIGHLECIKTFSSNITVCDAAVTSTDTPFVMAGTLATPTVPGHGSNAGGCIGNSIKNTTFSGAIIFNTEKISVASVLNNAGGCIGNIEGSATITGTVLTTGKGFGDVTLGTYNIFGAENVGGVIGSATKLTMKGIITVSMSELHIHGTACTGGCIGKFSEGQISDIGIVHFGESDAIIKGGSYTGGCIGLLSVNATINGKVLIEGKNNSIEGTSDNVGGVIGGMTGDTDHNTRIGSTASIRFLAEGSPVKGQNNTGGIVGLLQKGTVGDNSVITYSGKNSTITGVNNVGGIIGQCNNFTLNNTKLQISPDTYCRIEGSDCVGGIMGLGVGSDTNFTNKAASHTEVLLDKDTLVIVATGNVGGFVGELNNSARYSGCEIIVSNGSLLSITSTDKNAGGQIGYMANMNLGPGSSMTISCSDSQALIKGKTAAGGFVGIINGNMSANLYLTVGTSSSTSFTVEATGEGAGAGGIAGINYAVTGRTNDTGTTNIPGNGSIEVKATKGHAGALLGINYNSFTWKNGRLFVINATINDSNGITEPKDNVIGWRAPGSSDSNYKYQIGTTVYNWDFVPTP